MIIRIAKGKGGKGKICLMAAFAFPAEKKVLCDANVDAVDLHPVMAPKTFGYHDFQSGHTAVIEPEKCAQAAFAGL